MKSIKEINIMSNFQEPLWDDIQLEQIKEQQTEQLVGELVDYIIYLCDTVAKLRTEVNALTEKFNPESAPVYYEIHSDLCKSFEDHPCFSEFEKQLSRLINE